MQPVSCCVLPWFHLLLHPVLPRIKPSQSSPLLTRLLLKGKFTVVPQLQYLIGSKVLEDWRAKHISKIWEGLGLCCYFRFRISNHNRELLSSDFLFHIHTDLEVQICFKKNANQRETFSLCHALHTSAHFKTETQTSSIQSRISRGQQLYTLKPS